MSTMIAYLNCCSTTMVFLICVFVIITILEGKQIIRRDSSLEKALYCPQHANIQRVECGNSQRPKEKKAVDCYFLFLNCTTYQHHPLPMTSGQKKDRLLAQTVALNHCATFSAWRVSSIVVKRSSFFFLFSAKKCQPYHTGNVST